MKRIIAIALLALLGGCASFPLPQDRSTTDVLEVISLDGVIDDTTATDMRVTVDRINKDANIKAVLLTVDSPGGGAYASAVVYDELSRINVPVFAYCEAVCASGAVYAIMAPSVKFIALGQQSLIGSVGVIRAVRRQDVPEGVEIYKSGKFKQAGSVSPAIPGEVDYLQRIIDEAASTFYGVVAKARGPKINADGWVHIKNAEVFFGVYGVRIGLADAVMTREQALIAAADMAHSESIVTHTATK